MRCLTTMMVCVSFLLQSQLLAQAPSSPASASGAARPLASDKAAKSLQPLIDQAEGALASGEFKVARDTFSDALTIDPKNPTALSGLGMSYLGLKEYLKATPLLDKAVLAKPTDRTLVYNAAAAHLGAKNAMRAAKLLKEYLEAHPKDADEPMGNALAIALNQADAQAKKNSFYQIAAAYYKTYNAKLEAAAPGLKRWGIEWYSADDVAQKIADANAKQKDADAVAKEISSLDAKLATLNSELPNLEMRKAGGWDDPYVLQHQHEQIDSTQSDRNDKQKAYADILATVPQPSYPTAIEPVTAETMPPATVTAVSRSATASPPTVAQADPDAAPKRPRINVRVKRRIPTPGGNGNGNTGGNGNGGGASAPNSTDPPIIAKGGTTAQPPQAPQPPAAADPDSPAAPTPVRHSAVIQYAAAFPVAPDLLVTAAAPLEGATKIQLTTADGAGFNADVVRTDQATGLALLHLTDRKMSYLTLAADFKGGAIQCAAFPAANIFNPTAELLTGSAPAPTDTWKVRLSRHPRLPGAPLLVDGKVVGVQLANRDAEPMQLPAATLQQLRTFLAADLPATPGTGTALGCMLQLSATKSGS